MAKLAIVCFVILQIIVHSTPTERVSPDYWFNAKASLLPEYRIALKWANPKLWTDHTSANTRRTVSALDTNKIVLVTKSADIEELNPDDALNQNLITKHQYDVCKRNGVETLYPLDNGVGILADDALKANLITKRLYKHLNPTKLTLLPLDMLLEQKKLSTDEALNENVIVKREYNVYKLKKIDQILLFASGPKITLDKALELNLISRKYYEFLNDQAGTSFLELHTLIDDQCYTLKDALSMGRIKQSDYDQFKSLGVKVIVLRATGIAMFAEDALKLKIIDQKTYDEVSQQGIGFIIIKEINQLTVITLEEALEQKRITKKQYTTYTELGITKCTLTQNGPAIQASEAIKLKLVKRDQIQDVNAYILLTSFDNLTPVNIISVEDALEKHLFTQFIYEVLVKYGITTVTVVDKNRVAITAQQAVDAHFIDSVNDPNAMFIVPNVATITLDDAIGRKLITQLEYSAYQTMGVTKVIITMTNKLALDADDAIKLNCFTKKEAMAQPTMVCPLPDIISVDEALITNLINDIEYQFYKYQLKLKYLVRQLNTVGLTVDEAFNLKLIDENLYDQLKVHRFNTIVSLDLIIKTIKTVSIDVAFDTGLIQKELYELLKLYKITVLIILPDNQFGFTLEEARDLNLITVEEYEEYIKADIKFVPITILDTKTYSIEQAYKWGWITYAEYEYWKSQGVVIITRNGTPKYEIEIDIEQAKILGYITEEQYEIYVRLNITRIKIEVFKGQVETLPAKDVITKYDWTTEVIKKYFGDVTHITVVILNPSGIQTVISIKDAWHLQYITVIQYEQFVRDGITYIIVIGGGGGVIIINPVPSKTTTVQPDVITTTTVQPDVTTTTVQPDVTTTTVQPDVITTTTVQPDVITTTTVQPDVTTTTVQPDVTTTENSCGDTTTTEKHDFKVVNIDKLDKDHKITKKEYVFYKSQNITTLVITPDGRIGITIFDALKLHYITQKEYDWYVQHQIPYIIIDELKQYSILAAWQLDLISYDVYIKLYIAGVVRVIILTDDGVGLPLDDCFNLHLITKEEYIKYSAEHVAAIEISILDDKKFNIDEALKWKIISKELYVIYKELNIVEVTFSGIPYITVTLPLEDAYKHHYISKEIYDQYKESGTTMVIVTIPYEIVVKTNDRLSIEDAINFGYITVNDRDIYFKNDKFVNVIAVDKDFKHVISIRDAVFLNIISEDQYMTYVDENIKYIIIVPFSDTTTTTTVKIDTTTTSKYKYITIVVALNDGYITAKEYTYFQSKGVLKVILIDDGIAVTIKDALKLKLITKDDYETFKQDGVKIIHYETITSYTIELAYKLGKLTDERYFMYKNAGVTTIIIINSIERYISIGELRRLHLITDKDYNRYRQKNINWLPDSILDTKIFSLTDALNFNIITKYDYDKMKLDGVTGITRTGITYNYVDMSLDKALHNGYINRDVYNHWKQADRTTVLVYHLIDNNRPMDRLITLRVPEAIAQQFITEVDSKKYFNDVDKVYILVLSQYSDKYIIDLETFNSYGVLTTDEYNRFVSAGVKYLVIQWNKYLYPGDDVQKPIPNSDNNANSIEAIITGFDGNTIHVYTDKPLHIGSIETTIDEAVDTILTKEQHEKLKQNGITTIYITHDHQSSFIDFENRRFTVFDLFVTGFINYDDMVRYNNENLIVRFEITTVKPDKSTANFKEFTIEDAFSFRFIDERKYKDYIAKGIKTIYICWQYLNQSELKPYKIQDALKLNIISYDVYTKLVSNQIEHTLVFIYTMVENLEHMKYTQMNLSDLLDLKLITNEIYEKYSSEGYKIVYTNFKKDQSVYTLDDTYKLKYLSFDEYIKYLLQNVETVRFDSEIIFEKPEDQLQYRKLTISEGLKLFYINKETYAKLQSEEIADIFVIYKVTIVSWKEDIEKVVTLDDALKQEYITEEMFNAYKKRRIQQLTVTLSIWFHPMGLKRHHKYTLDKAYKLGYISQLQFDLLKQYSETGKAIYVYLIFTIEQPSVLMQLQDVYDGSYITESQFHDYRRDGIEFLFVTEYVSDKEPTFPTTRVVKISIDEAKRRGFLLQVDYDRYVMEGVTQVYKILLVEEPKHSKTLITIELALELNVISDDQYRYYKNHGVKQIYVLLKVN